MLERSSLVLAKLDRLDVGLEAELPDALELVVVPEHDFVEWVLWVLASSDKRQDVAAEQHLHKSDPSVELYER